jgi:uncharacterized membrane protein YsdA (DUF1294 family)
MSRPEQKRDAAIFSFAFKAFLPAMALCTALILYVSELHWLAKIYLVVVNAVTFGFYAFDKRRAINNEWRIPELQLHALSLAGGAIGAAIGRRLCRHKIRKWSFTFVILIGLAVTGLVAASALKQATRPVVTNVGTIHHVA